MIADYKEIVENMRNNGDCITADIIEQLSINNDLLKNECDGLALQYGKCASNYAKLQIEYDTIAKMYAKVNEDLCVRTKERDAIYADMKTLCTTISSICDFCKNNGEKIFEECICTDWFEFWEWRGVRSEENVR